MPRLFQSFSDQLVYEDMLTEKGGHTHNYHQAAREAYRYLTPKLCNAIIAQIKQ